MELQIRKARGRGNSDPVPKLGSTLFAASPLRNKRRRTASMEATLYDDDYNRYVRHTFHPEIGKEGNRPWSLDPPPPLFSHSQLDEKVVEHMYFYSHYRLKLRRVSPRSLPFLQKFRDTAEMAMKAPTLELKTQLAAWNYTLHSATILRMEPSFKDKEAYNALKDITIFRYLAEYGDYLAEECAAFRSQALKKKEKLCNVETFVEGKTWQLVQSQVDKEDVSIAEWRHLCRGGGTWTCPKTPTTSAIKNACIEMNLDEDNMFYNIRMYAQRNELMRCMIGVHIKNHSWVALAQQLAKDYRDLPKVFGKKEQKYMSRVLDRVKNRFFLSIDDPSSPILSDEAIRRSQARTETEKKRLENGRMKKEKEGREAQQLKRT